MELLKYTFLPKEVFHVVKMSDLSPCKRTML